MTPALPSVAGRGPASPRIMIVTEFATADDLWKGYPLAGNLGDMFAKFLHEAGIIRAECYVTTVSKTRPKDDTCNHLYTTTKSTAQKTGLTEVLHGVWVHPSVPPMVEALHTEVQAHSPTVIIALGDFSMFALTGVYGSVDTWRGSHLDLRGPKGVYSPITVIPTYTPSMVRIKWEVKGFCIRDLQRVRDIALHPQYYIYPSYSFTIRPTFTQVKETLLGLLSVVLGGKELPLAVDIETIARHISCIGLAWSAREALCIPYMTLDGHYWSEEEEVEISFLLKSLLTHPLTRTLGQNFNYDNQHFAKHFG